MAVFDGSVKTPRRVADPTTDKLISSVASLALPAINTLAALLYPGTDVSVVHGDQHLQVNQNRMMRVGLNHDVGVGMNEIYQVDMNRTMTVLQNYTRSVMMNSTITVTGNYAKSVLSNYTKTISGISTNTILSNYFKTVHADYTKSVLGNSGNTINGSYTKAVESDYVKHVTGPATTTVIGDYTKTLKANYSKSITGTSAINVTGTSNENYTGDHSRMYTSNHKTYIVGNDNHTTLGSTLWSKIGPKLFGQTGAHQQQHDDTSQDDRETWFKHTWKEGITVGEQIELIGLGQCFTANKIEFAGTAMEGIVAKLELGSIANAYKVSVNHGIVVKNEEKAAHEELVATIKEKIAPLDSSLNALKSDTAAMHEEIGALADRGEPLNLFLGVLFGGNQFAM
jgi:hypothetical protein